MKKSLVWDLPTRLFHWAFALSVTLSFVFAFAVGEHSPLFQLHMLFGLIAVFLLVLRLTMAFFGSRYARFTSFPVHPVEVVRYFTGVVSGQARKYAGHNPGSALATLAMLVLVPVIALTGALGDGEAFEEVHEVLSYVLLCVIGAHLLGIVLHTLRHRENIALSMIDGRKSVAPEEAIASGHPIWGAAFSAAAIAWVFALFSNHDVKAATVRLPVVGAVVQLGENEREENAQGKNERGGNHDQRRHGGDHDGDDD
jgi:cytochrome b